MRVATNRAVVPDVPRILKDSQLTRPLSYNDFITT